MSLSYGQRRSLAKRANRLAAQWDREAVEAAEAQREARRVVAMALEAAQAERDAQAPCDIDGLEAGDWVRDRFGWHQVVRVNRKSVTVSTPYSWTDRLGRDRITETRKALP